MARKNSRRWGIGCISKKPKKRKKDVYLRPSYPEPETIDKMFDQLVIGMECIPSENVFRKECRLAMPAIILGFYNDEVDTYRGYLRFRGITHKSIFERFRKISLEKLGITPELIEERYMQFRTELERPPKEEEFFQRYPQESECIVKKWYRENIDSFNKFQFIMEINPERIELDYITLRKELGRHPLSKEFGKKYLQSYRGLREGLHPHTMNYLQFRKYIEHGKLGDPSVLLQDSRLKDLSLLSICLGPDGVHVEEAILELYKGRFKDREELHDLLEKSQREFTSLIEQGVTHLGPFIGGYTLSNEKQMAPVFLGNVLTSFSLEKMTPSLEKILLRVANGIYDPQFNANPSQTISTLDEKSKTGNIVAQKVYGVLIQEYKDILLIADRLKKYDSLREKS